MCIIKHNRNIGLRAGHLKQMLVTVSCAAMLIASATLVPAIAGQQTQLLRGSQAEDTPAELVEVALDYIVPEQVETNQAPSSLDELRVDPPLIPIVEIGSGIVASSGYVLKNTFDALLFRGSTHAVADRAVVIELPSRQPLRQSMLHSVNYETGLRGGTVSIAESVSTALRGSYSTRERLEKANAEKARMHTAMAKFLPSLSATFEATNSKRNSVSSGSYRQDNLSVTLEASMPIFTSGVNINTYRQAKHISIAADYSYLAEEHRATIEAVTAHVNLRLNRKIENRLSDNVAAMQRVLKIADKLYQAGDTSKTDVAIAKANVESARSELDLARRSREETQTDYKSVTGQIAPTSLSLSKAESLLPASLEQAIASAMANNPQLQASRHTAIASEHNAKVVRGRFGPQVDAFGRYDKYFYDSVQEDREDDYTVGVRVRVPILDFSAVPSINAARHEAAEFGYKSLEQERLVRRQVERQWSAYHSAHRRVAIVQRQVDAVARSVNGVKKEYEAGFRSITDVLTDQVKLTRAQITLETARHERILAAHQLAITTAHDGVKHLALAN